MPTAYFCILSIHHSEVSPNDFCSFGKRKGEEDCTHYDICIFHIKGDENEKCVHFKNKADVVEARHGYWKDNRNGTFTCSACGGQASKMDWCGRCGAKMDGKGEV